MPVVEGGVDIPALEWCSILEAAIWIEHKQPPVPFSHEGALPNRIYPPLGQFRDLLHFCNDGWNKLYVLACAGGVTLRGHPAIGYQELGDSNGLPYVRCQSWGELVDIPKDRITEGGLFGFMNGGLLFCHETSSGGWAYQMIKVDFRQLLKRHPSPQGQEFRIGGAPVLVDANSHSINFIGQSSNTTLAPLDRGIETPQKLEEPSNLTQTTNGIPTVPVKANIAISKKKNVGGRPQLWDWDGGIAATTLAIYSGDLDENDRVSWLDFMMNWLTESHLNKEIPDIDDTRKRIAKIEIQVKARIAQEQKTPPRQ